jgi:hypothetical protein
MENAFPLIADYFGKADKNETLIFYREIQIKKYEKY